MSADAHTHIAVDGTRTLHSADECPLPPYKGKRYHLNGNRMNQSPLLDEWVDGKGRTHKRRPGS